MVHDQEKQELALKIDEARIREHFVEIPTQIAFAGNNCAMLGKDAARRNFQYKEQRAVTKEQLRALASAKGERMTESRLDAMVESDTSVGNAYRQYLDAQEEYDFSKAHLEGLRTKRDMLVNLGAHLRTEMQTMEITQLGKG